MSKYIDLDINFTKHPITGDVSVVKDDNAIRQSLKNLLTLNFYDAPFQPEKGTQIGSILFEPVSETSVVRIQKIIQDMVEKYEPRVEVLDVQVQIMEETGYAIQLFYRVINTIEPKTLNFILELVR